MRLVKFRSVTKVLFQVSRYLMFTFGLVVTSIVNATDQSENTPIDEYVAQLDASYKWTVVDRRSEDGVTTVTIDLTSQTWLDFEQVNQPEWRHWLILSIPQNVRSDIGMLFIGGGSNRNSWPKASNEQTLTIARMTQTVVAELKMVPNQPLIFNKDGVPRTEDDLIAYTWDQFLTGAEPVWLARNAMVKSAVRAMDTVTNYTSMKENSDFRIDKFVIAGASKRGWTSWITAAVDKRVVGLIPIVIDVLNVDKSMRHHFSAYGFWAPAISDYVRHGIMERLSDPKLAELYEIVDPYHYIDRLDMPKLILNAAGDQFFLPDSSQFYYDDLIGPKLIRYVPNTDHSMRDSDVLTSLIGFYDAIVSNIDLPSVSWTYPSENVLVLQSDISPTDATLWVANNPRARDFRLETVGPIYTPTPLKLSDGDNQTLQIPTPEKGWNAYFVEFTYDIGAATPLKVSTEVKVIPDILPFSNKSPMETNSVTLVCKSIADPKNSRLEIQKLLQNKNIATNGLKSYIDSEDIYFNWSSLLEFQSGFTDIRKILASKNCNEPKIQLESGPEITLPPLP